MAKEQITPPVGIIKSQIWQDKDHLLLEMSGGEEMIELADGNIISLRSNTSIVTVCGNIWFPGKEDAGICSVCQNPPRWFLWRPKPTHGIVLIRNSRVCTCGTRVCPKHAHKYGNGLWLCPRCLFWKRLFDFFTSMVTSKG